MLKKNKEEKREKNKPLKKRKKVDPTHVQIIKILCLTFKNRIYGPADELNMVSVTIDEKYYHDENTMNNLTNLLYNLNSSNVSTKMVIEKEKEKEQETNITINVFYAGSEDCLNEIIKNHFGLTDEEVNKNPIIIN